MNLAETYDRIAEDWHRDHASDTWWQEGTNAFITHLPSGGTVLDVGCGSGVKSKYFLDRGFSVTGIDIAEKLLSIARREAPGGSYRQLSMVDLDQLAETFDGVFAQASLLHIPKAEAPAVVRKMVERAKPGGHIYLAVKEAREGKPEEAIERENDYGYERFFSYYTMAELERYLTDAGATVVWQSRNPNPSGKTVWLQIIAKR
ncbi:MAG: class I SAM-dependent methyltransferase [Patescibacteria group bacterium]|nr:methyltransferase domain-containing protein [Patescibacteria group bacterium]MDE1943903.1 class I SAM-dependent methyltransferase [Patescibacteria group bacterium]MDE1945268.1 class I SAM-dependent methyltransferase [Patescibacteria group bacterium]MDE2057412.1 class I SAM-dependent methyltransferase [Patescibacteria group bacterium]